MTVADLPKVELHLHLEGGAPPEFIRRIAGEKSVDLGGIFNEDGSYAYRDFWHFLEVYEAATSVLQSPEDFHRLVRAVLAESAANGVVYSETFLSPDFCGGRDVGAWKEYLAAMIEAADAAERDDGIILRGIITPIRHFGPDKARETAICAAETAGDWIVGFGIGGDEKQGKLADFAWAFDCAREAGLRITAHAGEWGGPDSIRDALTLNPERIGHGVRAIEDLALVDRLIEDEIVLETCPGSNVFLGVFPSWDKHPIAELRDRGAKVTVSTDDPPFFHTNMRREFDRLAETFGWEEDDFRALNQTALDAAFCDDETRARVTKILEGYSMLEHLTVVKHPLIQHKLTLMREKNTPTAVFRQLLREISQLLAFEITRTLPMTSKTIETPMCEMEAPTLDGPKLALVSILRAGNGLLDGVLELIPSARVGFVGLYRDEETLQPVEYYFKVPEGMDRRLVIAVDPMLATGNSSAAAITRLKQAGAKDIRFMCLLAAPEGVQTMKEEHPDVPIVTAALDSHLNEIGYIVPGLGDAGDRMFGTK